MSDLVQDAIDAAGISMTTEVMPDGRFRCDLVSAHGRLRKSVDAPTDAAEPDLYRVIFRCAMEAQHLDECDDITDWATDMKKDLAAPGVLAEFQEAMDERRDFEFLLSYRVFEQLMTGLAIYQAIGGARPR